MTDTRVNQMLFEPLEAAFAFDIGATDSGFKDVERVKESLAQLAALPPDERRIVVARWARDTFLTDEALEAGYGLDDAISFDGWIRRQ